MEDLRAAPEGAVVVLHACAHNPPGVDPTPEQWGGILEVVRRRRLLPFFDSAYQGFASGCLDRDAAPVRLFADAGLEMLLAQVRRGSGGRGSPREGVAALAAGVEACAEGEKGLCAAHWCGRRSWLRPLRAAPPGQGGSACCQAALGLRLSGFLIPHPLPAPPPPATQSFAKNMGLYGERVGAVTVVVADPGVKGRVESQLRSTVRAMYSSPPKHGAAIVSTILNDPALFAAWRVELRAMADRINSMRAALYDALLAAGAPGDWTHITKQIGMFSFTGLTQAREGRRGAGCRGGPGWLGGTKGAAWAAWPWQRCTVHSAGALIGLRAHRPCRLRWST